MATARLIGPLILGMPEMDKVCQQYENGQDESLPPPPTPSIYLNSEAHFHTSTSIHGSHEKIKKASDISDFKKSIPPFSLIRDFEKQNTR